MLNTVMGGLMAYGLTGLRYTGYAIVMYLVVLCLQALTSNQLQIFCVWLTPNQVSYAGLHPPITALIAPAGLYNLCRASSISDLGVGISVSPWPSQGSQGCKGDRNCYFLDLPHHAQPSLWHSCLKKG